MRPSILMQEQLMDDHYEKLFDEMQLTKHKEQGMWNEMQLIKNQEEGRLEKDLTLTPMVMYKAMGMYYKMVKIYLESFIVS